MGVYRCLNKHSLIFYYYFFFLPFFLPFPWGAIGAGLLKAALFFSATWAAMTAQPSLCPSFQSDFWQATEQYALRLRHETGGGKKEIYGHRERSNPPISSRQGTTFAA